MRKRRRKAYSQNTASRNALVEAPSRKRFGKKQKKKLMIIAVILLVISLSASYAIKQHKLKIAAQEEKARRGEILDRNAEKQEFDDDGNLIIHTKATEIHFIDCGNGNSTLVKKGNYEVLIDAGGDVTDYLLKNVSGDLEYIIFTNNFEGCISGAQSIYENFNVLNTIYTNPNEEVDALIDGRNAEEAAAQSVDLGENTTVSILKGIDESDTDKTSIILIKDNDYTFFLAGQASDKNIIKNLNNNRYEAYILGGNITAPHFSGKIMRGLSPECVIASTDKKLSGDIISACNEYRAYVYATYKSKNIIFKIDGNNIIKNVEYEDVIQIEEEEKEGE